MIILPGLSQEEIIQQYVKAGVSAHITKPFLKQSLFDTNDLYIPTYPCQQMPEVGNEPVTWCISSGSKNCVYLPSPI